MTLIQLHCTGFQVPKKKQLSSERPPYVVRLSNQTHHKLVQFENISLKSESNSSELFGWLEILKFFQEKFRISWFKLFLLNNISRRF